MMDRSVASTPSSGRRRTRLSSETAGPFGAIVKLLLLTGQRREKVASMMWSDIKDGVWTIATEKREKGNAGVLRLPPVAVEIIAAQDEVVGNPYLFPGDERGRRHKTADRSRPPCFNGWSKSKIKLDARLPADMPSWTLHDLRRTARSLMSRAGVPATMPSACWATPSQGSRGSMTATPMRTRRLTRSTSWLS